MAFENTWEQHGVVKRFTGFLTASEFIKSTEDVGAAPRFDNLSFVINDFMDVDGNDINADTVKYIGAMHAGRAFTNPNICVAFVATDRELAAITERINDVLFRERHVMKAFATMDEARAWLQSQHVSERIRE
jgi:hypothetical protein